MATFLDELELDDETPSERLARLLAEADYKLIHDLRLAREAQNLTQAQLGAILGVAQASVSAFESGEADAKLSTIRRYAHALGVTVGHSVRTYDLAAEGFVGTAVPSNRQKTPVHSYVAATSKRSDFALGA